MSATAKKNRRQALGFEIEKQLKAGIDINASIAHFMRSTYAVEGPPELERLLEDSDDSEILPLLELLFEPNEAVQIELEKTIADQVFSEEDTRAMVRQLSGKQLEIPVRFPEKRGTFSLTPPGHLLETYVLKLNISKQLPEALVDALSRYTAGSTRSAVRVKFRNTRLHLSPAICVFFGKFLQKTDQTTGHFLPDLEECLSIFSERPTAPSLFDCFMEKKRRLLLALEQAHKFEKQLAENNMETLMLRGVRAPHVDKAATRTRITRINAICLAVFGVTDPLLQGPTDVDLGNFRNRDDLQKAFEMLSSL